MITFNRCGICGKIPKGSYHIVIVQLEDGETKQTYHKKCWDEN